MGRLKINPLFYLAIYSSGRRETQAHLMEERLRAQKYSREMNEKSTTVQPQHTSSESGDFDVDSEDDFLELDGDDDDNVRIIASILNDIFFYVFNVLIIIFSF